LVANSLAAMFWGNNNFGAGSFNLIGQIKMGVAKNFTAFFSEKMEILFIAAMA
jgi:hypothetical protein